MTDLQKNEIQALIDRAKMQLGSQAAVATRAGVSAATISQVQNNNWDLIKDSMWRKIGAAMGWNPTGWQLEEITNTKILRTVFQDARMNALFMAVSYKAGSGKTASANYFLTTNTGEAVYLIKCREWTRRQFLSELCKHLGIPEPAGYVSCDILLSLVTEFFLQRAHLKPLLIIDEADKLKASALLTLIPLYNETEDRMGLVIMGTENLKKEILRGVRYAKKGYDEIDSRFSRRYIELKGATWSDVKAICNANGVTEASLQRAIWNECGPVQADMGGQFVKVVDDLRRLKRSIQRETIKSNHNHNGN